MRAQLFNEKKKPGLSGLPTRNRIIFEPIQLPHVQEEETNMEMKWWLVLIALLILVIVGGAILRWEFWTGVF